MNQERDLARTHIAPSAPAHDDDLAPGRASRSSQMDAPTRPWVGGLLQRKARDTNGVADNADAAVERAASSSVGSPLPEPIMRKFESSLGVNLSSVRIHTGHESASAVQAVGAHAYTIGQDIHFGAGQYDPSSDGGQHLLAHEVAHTVQQRGGSPTRQNKLEVSSPGDEFEIEADRAAGAMVVSAPAPIEADRVADRVVADEQAGPIGASPRGLSRQPAETDDADSEPPKVTTGDLKSIPNWTYIAYRDQKRVRLRYFNQDVQVGTIPWITNNPGDLTVDSSQPKGSAQQEPYAQGAAKLGPRDTRYRRYAIFANQEAGVFAIQPYLKKLYEGNVAANPKARSMTLLQVLKIYKGTDANETDEVKDKYVNEIQQFMAESIVQANPETTPQAALTQAREYLNRPFADVENAKLDIMGVHSTNALMKEEGLGRAPGVEYAHGGFVSNEQKRYDVQKWKLIEELKGSENANSEIRGLIGE